MSSSHRRARHACLGLALVAGLAVGGSPATAGGVDDYPVFALDHFQCYRLAHTHFAPRTVHVRDQFLGRRVRVVARTVLCNPVSKDGSAVHKPRAHLVCYAVRPAKIRHRHVRVQNQFEPNQALTVKALGELCVPSGKRLGRGPAPGRVTDLNHFTCYRARADVRFTRRTVHLVDQFRQSTPLIVGPGALCNPARKNRSAVRDPQEHLVCYGIQPHTGGTFHPRRVRITNQFERNRRVRAVAPLALCVPSFKRVV